VAEYLAIKDFKQARVAVSSTYAILLMIVVPILLLFGFFLHFANWNAIFNTRLNETELMYTVATVFVGLLLQFFLKPISSVLQGDQKIYKANMIQLICNAIPLVPIILMSKYLKGSMVALGFAQTVLPVFVLLVYTLVLFRKEYAVIRPSVKHINLAKSKSLFGLSLAFFIVQIAGVFLFSTTELIISREFGGADVTLYNLLYKYFSTVTLVLNIVLGSYWNAFTNAFTLNDYAWVKASMAKLNKITALLVLLLAAQVLLINPVFKFWVGDKIHVPLTLSLIMAVYFVAYLYTAVYTIILNGAGRVKVQAIVSIVTAALHIPVVLFFIRYLHWGLNSIVFSGLLWVVIQFIAWRSEIKSVLRREAVQPDDQFDDDIVKTSKLLA
jgi:O-antigen/teichoic acid export membrane protein